MLGIVEKINSLLDEPSKAQELMTCLQKPEANLPHVDSTRPYLYMDNLQREKIEKEDVRIFICWYEIVLWPKGPF